MKSLAALAARLLRDSGGSQPVLGVAYTRLLKGWSEAKQNAMAKREACAGGVDVGLVQGLSHVISLPTWNRVSPDALRKKHLMVTSVSRQRIS